MATIESRPPLPLDSFIIMRNHNTGKDYNVLEAFCDEPVLFFCIF